MPNARKAFETFFVVWKDADPDIAILQQARADMQAAMNRQQQGTRKAIQYRSGQRARHVR